MTDTVLVNLNDLLQAREAFVRHWQPWANPPSDAEAAWCEIAEITRSTTNAEAPVPVGLVRLCIRLADRLIHPPAGPANAVHPNVQSLARPAAERFRAALADAGLPTESTDGLHDTLGIIRLNIEWTRSRQQDRDTYGFAQARLADLAAIAQVAFDLIDVIDCHVKAGTVDRGIEDVLARALRANPLIGVSSAHGPEPEALTPAEVVSRLVEESGSMSDTTERAIRVFRGVDGVPETFRPTLDEAYRRLARQPHGMGVEIIEYEMVPLRRHVVTDHANGVTLDSTDIGPPPIEFTWPWPHLTRPPVDHRGCSAACLVDNDGPYTASWPGAAPGGVLAAMGYRVAAGDLDAAIVEDLTDLRVFRGVDGVPAVFTREQLDALIDEDVPPGHFRILRGDGIAPVDVPYGPGPDDEDDEVLALYPAFPVAEALTRRPGDNLLGIVQMLRQTDPDASELSVLARLEVMAAAGVVARTENPDSWHLTGLGPEPDGEDDGTRPELPPLAERWSDVVHYIRTSPFASAADPGTLREVTELVERDHIENVAGSELVSIDPYPEASSAAFRQPCPVCDAQRGELCADLDPASPAAYLQFEVHRARIEEFLP